MNIFEMKRNEPVVAVCQVSREIALYGLVTSDPQVRITVSTSDRISAGSLAMSAGSDGVAKSGNGGCSCRCAKVRSLTPDMSVISEHSPELSLQSLRMPSTSQR